MKDGKLIEDVMGVDDLQVEDMPLSLECVCECILHCVLADKTPKPADVKRVMECDQLHVIRLVAAGLPHLARLLAAARAAADIPSEEHANFCMRAR